MTPEVSALVVTWNSVADIAACLEALLAVTDVRLEVVVVDNASTDGTRAALEPFRQRVKLVLSDENTGYAQGNVLAARHATGEHLLLVNPDCTVGPTTLSALLGHLRTSPRCGAASALLVNPDGSPQLFARREPTFLRSLPWFLASVERWDRRRGGPLRARREYRRLLLDPPATPFEVDCPAAACVLLRREALTGELFDPSYPLFFNDVDLYRRLRLDGWAVQVVPEAVARHGHGRSHRQVPTDSKRAEQLLSLRRYARATWPRPLPRLLDLLLRLDAQLCTRTATRWPAEEDFLRAQVRGSLGALGADGGATPFLSHRESP